MRRSKRLYHAALALFLAAECVLGVLVHTVRPGAVPWVSYAAVLLAFAFCFLSARKSATYALSQLALLFTLAADYILVLHPEYSKLLAMLFFSVVQLAYGARLLLEAEGRRPRAVQAGVRAALSLLAVLLTLLVVGEAADALALVSMFYFANLLWNAALALLAWRRSPTLALGLVLFVLCDLFVGLSMLDAYLPIAEGTLLAWMASPPINMAWVFYIPSQTLLSLSSRA